MTIKEKSRISFLSKSNKVQKVHIRFLEYTICDITYYISSINTLIY